MRTILYLSGAITLMFATGCAAETVETVDVPASASAYANVLASHVNETGAVDYASLKKNRDELDAYAAWLAEVSDTTYQAWSASEKIAFWLNAYNAITLQSIIDHYPLTDLPRTKLTSPANSIRQIPGVWKKTKHRVQGRKLTLDDIEHKILRVDFDEPRIHMGLVCASVGCPFLRTEPYTGTALDTQLREQTEQFLNDPTKFKFDPDRKRAYLSPLFKWFGKDFIKSYAHQSPAHLSEVERAVLEFIRQHLSPETAAKLGGEKLRIRYLDYDWSLNE